jgi:hypothetical protein
MTMASPRDPEAMGCHRAVLHASDMGMGVYERCGFVERCRFMVYATAELWAEE